MADRPKIAFITCLAQIGTESGQMKILITQGKRFDRNQKEPATSHWHDAVPRQPDRTSGQF